MKLPEGTFRGFYYSCSVSLCVPTERKCLGYMICRAKMVAASFSHFRGTVWLPPHLKNVKYIKVWSAGMCLLQSLHECQLLKYHKLCPAWINDAWTFKVIQAPQIHVLLLFAFISAHTLLVDYELFKLMQLKVLSQIAFSFFWLDRLT